ncbi:fimbria/pilus outer membrane usher protein [Pseudomonas typographi]|uniref:fimbria/pilus outer membrane usher protein n=1 Tax=Pseudomonas typographi TaxID=2715964 RepID=UPI001687880D|nr:fimbria/pilus outer membrane usher protein [Pseudomonas typographi]MBD1554885.1 fimbria/pilus outer membrane usher protein [Pseudomonas typographi]
MHTAAIRVAGATALVLVAVTPAWATEPQALEFDEKTLRQRGIDPTLAKYFRAASRFMQGPRRIDLTLNGQRARRVAAMFDEQGQLCFDPAFLQQASLALPAKVAKRLGEVDCYDFLGAYPNSQVELRPAEEAVSLVVSQQALRPKASDASAFSHGGVAGVFNYDVFATRSEGRWGRQQQYFASTELGLNAAGWTLRSRQSHSQGPYGSTSDWLHTYAQTTLEAQRALLQLGQLTLQNPVLGGIPITGMQWLPETALANQQQRLSPIGGIAHGPARVEVRQGQALIYSTLVPEGPFTLTDVKPLSTQGDLEVSVIEGSGVPRVYHVPLAAVLTRSAPAAGLSLAVGQARSYAGHAQATPWVASAGGGMALGNAHTLGLGGLISQSGYLALGVTLDAQWTDATGGGLALALARTRLPQEQGGSLSASLRHRMGERWQASATFTQRTPGYRTLGQTLGEWDDYGFAYRSQGLALGWATPLLGSFSFNYVQAFSTTARRAVSTHWNRKFGDLSVSARLERDISPANQGGYNRFVRNDRTGFHVSVSAPLGQRRRVSGYARDSGQGLRLGTQYSAPIGERANYRVHTERNQASGVTGSGADIDWLGSATRLNMGVNDTGDGARTWMGRASGGAALHAGGVTVAPVALGDTFALASVGDIADVRLDTPAGPVWTNRNGQALIPQLGPYQTAEVRIATPTLPRNVEIENAVQGLSVGRGSVQRVDFTVQRTRRALLTVRTSDGEWLPKGSGVFDGDRALVTAVATGGKVYLPDAQAHQGLWVQLDEARSCRLHFSLADAADPARHYEHVQARCLEEDV